MVDVLENKYPGKFLAVLFKNLVISKDVFDSANSELAPPGIKE